MSLRHYKDVFDGYKLDRNVFQWWVSGVNESHREFFDLVLDFYSKNQSVLVEKQKKGLGTDQTPINYLGNQWYRFENVTIDI